MSEDLRTRIFTLAKVMIAAAWADGQISEEEKQCLKDLLFHLPDAGLEAGIQMTGQEWAMLEMYMESPIDAAEQERLITELQDAIRNPQEKEIVVSYLQQMAAADGEPTAAELVLIDEIMQEGNTSNGSNGGVLGRIGRFFGGTMQKRATAVAHAPNREAQFDDFLKNKVYYELQQQLAQQGKSLDLSDAEVRRMGLAGGLAARVAHVDETPTEAEINRMAELIGRFWELDAEMARFVAETAVSAVDYTYDYYRMTRQFGEATTYEERVRFLDVLFQIALADGFVSYEETEEIRLIAHGINLSNQEFINAKIKIPREQRAD
ncbi:MAG TPA: TerB family tellurite resistance protein [Chloroflexota bacterium]|nr:TerB family tellurite resistance protein [Chloroflexota bacterium]HUM70425.1 TerB family tellurite resistance protein [Chloroflexota bacterium]